jgi:hypothetical protein
MFHKNTGASPPRQKEQLPFPIKANKPVMPRFLTCSHGKDMYVRDCNGTLKVAVCGLTKDEKDSGERECLHEYVTKTGEKRTTPFFFVDHVAREYQKAKKEGKVPQWVINYEGKAVEEMPWYDPYKDAPVERVETQGILLPSGMSQKRAADEGWSGQREPQPYSQTVGADNELPARIIGEIHGLLAQLQELVTKQ